MGFMGEAPDPADLCSVRYLFTDIDDTLTTGGRLLPETYAALWRLSEAGIVLIPVTGGSAGWCEHIARVWPVGAVIGESGAFVVLPRGDRVRFEFWEGDAAQRERQQGHLACIRELLVGNGRSEFLISEDQGFRLSDVAIEIAGHEPEEVDVLAERIRALGARAAISSIHINTWIGDYDKRAMSERVLSGLFEVSAEEVPGATAFVGDSRNDAPMFGYIRNAFAVANIVPHLPRLPHPPRWITRERAGIGFVAVANALLAARMSPPESL